MSHLLFKKFVISMRFYRNMKNYIHEETVEAEDFRQVPSTTESPHEETRLFTFSANRNFPSNFITHQKYTKFNIIPKFLFLQFRFFFNFFYLVITLVEIIPAFRIGFLITYVSPLVFVLTISFVKEVWDEIQRARRDKELNSQRYTLITENGPQQIESQNLLVGHIIEVNSGDRVPADLILLRTSEEGGSAFIKTDQLDGETDWKLRRSLGFTQNCGDLFQFTNLRFEIESPRANIYDFSGRAMLEHQIHPIGVESTVWSNTVVACGKIIGVVAYTSTETRSAMNASPASVKVGVFEREVNKFSSVLFALLFVASFIAAGINGVSNNFIVLLVRFVLLFSFIIPISMRVNLDLSKLIFASRVGHDDQIEGAIIRNSNLPEELGRIHFLFTDKTGTLTRNEMEFKKMQYDNVVLDGNSTNPPHPMSLLALALCHCVNVTEDGFQASSPDEIALVKHASKIGYKLVARNDDFIDLEISNSSLSSNPLSENRKPGNIGNVIERFEILATLPFSSVWSHMGIVLRNEKYGSFIVVKGADASISTMCPPSEWLDEVVGNLAREGLRTLVFAYKSLNNEEVEEFLKNFQAASSSVINRSDNILKSFTQICTNMEILGVTGVEDKLQENVPETLEALEAAKIKVWMLTGDKMETAICIALSSRLFTRDMSYKIIRSLSDLVDCMNLSSVPPLVIDGRAIQWNLLPEFLNVILKSPAVVVCRCSPSQKETVVKSVMKSTEYVTCAIGDGGNDVSMIQASSIGIGIVGKEGKQASLSADVSINSFCHLQRLLFWHGANCYKHSARLAQFVMHRGVIMTVTQAIYSLLFNVVPSPLYNDWLMMGFATFFTSCPVFSLIFDWFIDEKTVIAFPELYVPCQKGRFFSPKTFINWICLAIYQGGAIILVTVTVFGIEGIDERHLQSISFTALILTELVLIAIEVNHFNIISILSEMSSLLIYVLTMFILTDAFDIPFIMTMEFFWKIFLLTLICIAPLLLYVGFKKLLNPTHEELLKPSYDQQAESNFYIL
ncbi:phospholipid-translocating P-type ATPase, flippase family protein [Tritrichomonas foetus]|uniref:Phospholipid-transporting ATPase n=1 Tax=Tritrichomonas foetus TaxID=1144522 RepID=A0A1J4JZ80_9EUKA|nr:phospholipid-translocating P-type ATPase, flippase family protein [Tritrichomonas foetus]|eukprot:OHT04465.1 phospholipid-translocating P-type ATPase, flippase family protein [Tritrichomonas foetus]